MKTTTLEPLPLQEVRPPARRLPPRRWIKENLFGTWLSGVLTVLLAALLGWALYKIARFVFVDARWEIVEVNLRNFLVFRFPRDETWRLWAALYLVAAAFGAGAGVAARRRDEEVREGRAEPPSRLLTLRRLGPLLAVALVFLWFAKSLDATLLVAGAAATWLAARAGGRLVPRRRRRWAVGAVVLVAASAYAMVAVVALGGVGWERWGGLLLTVFLAVGGIVISFPLGVLLALGRRSRLPAVRIVCIAYIELVRGVPLITVLFMGAFMLGFFLPPGS